MTKAPTATEIARMRARNYDRETIRQAEELLERYENAIRPLQARIREAFAGVRLGNGVGLRQARALDDHWDDAVAARARVEDEILDWSSISTETLLTYGGSLSFFDAEGMRFHLPAFLLAETEGECGGLVFHLTFDHDEADKASHHQRFELLSANQRQVVRSFLLLALEDEGSPFGRDGIRRALEEYWTDPD